MSNIKHETTNYYKLTLAYDGSSYCGWQIQKNGLSIHEAMMIAGRKFMGDNFTITGCSRTDSGVHALSYVALLVSNRDIEVRKIPRAFNGHLPKDIVVHNCERVSESFHPRYTSKSKHYRYTIYNNDYPLPQYIKYAYYYYKKLNVTQMQLAAKAFVGTHDFIGFSSIKTSVKDTVRTIYNCQVTREENYIHIDIKGDGFLYNMVRIIAGSLIEVGLEKNDAKDMSDIITAKDRNLAKKTAPANGLTLVGLTYNNE